MQERNRDVLRLSLRVHLPVSSEEEQQQQISEADERRANQRKQQRLHTGRQEVGGSEEDARRAAQAAAVQQQQGAVNHTPIRRDPKIGRNDPCPCGSGKKYKNCCGANEQVS